MLSLQWVLLRNLPSPIGYPFALQALGFVVVNVGVILFFNAVFAFKRHETTILPFEDSTSRIIDSGPFRISRNPIYLAEAIMLTGTCVMWGHVSPWLTVPLFVVGIDRSVITWEEAALQRRFGAAYDSYCQRTRRWM